MPRVVVTTDDHGDVVILVIGSGCDRLTAAEARALAAELLDAAAAG